MKMLICLQCGMKAILEGREPPTFDETEATHIRKYHSNPEQTKRERAELERQLAEKFKQDPLRFS